MLTRAELEGIGSRVWLKVDYFTGSPSLVNLRALPSEIKSINGRQKLKIWIVSEIAKWIRFPAALMYSKSEKPSALADGKKYAISRVSNIKYLSRHSRKLHERETPENLVIRGREKKIRLLITMHEWAYESKITTRRLKAPN